MGATKSENHKFQPAYRDDSFLPFFFVSVTFIYPFSYFNSIRRPATLFPQLVPFVLETMTNLSICITFAAR